MGTFLVADNSKMFLESVCRCFTFEIFCCVPRRLAKTFFDEKLLFIHFMITVLRLMREMNQIGPQYTYHDL